MGKVLVTALSVVVLTYTVAVIYMKLWKVLRELFVPISFETAD